MTSGKRILEIFNPGLLSLSSQKTIGYWLTMTFCLDLDSFVRSTLGDLSKLCLPLYLLYLARKCHGQKRSLRCQGSGVKYELVEKSDDIVFCHRLFQEVFAYHHVVTRQQTKVHFIIACFFLGYLICNLLYVVLVLFELR